MAKNSERIDALKQQISNMPNNPGIYQYFNKEGKIIYVGKAKNLKKRVSSYFTKNHDDSPKTRILVRNIHEIKYMVVKSEEDALLLENSLIKKHQPRFNVRLKDDKTYPWICVKAEDFPRVFYTRKAIKDGSLYFGPYTSVRMVRTLIDFIRQIYKIRTCALNLSKENIAKGKYKVCLEYHIGNCKGPCIGKVEEAAYRAQLEDIKHILKGNIKEVKEHLKQQMLDLAKELKFEEANEVKEKYQLIDNYQSKSTVVSPTITNVDVFSILDDKEIAYVNYLRVIDGAIVQSHTIELKRALEETTEELFITAIAEIRQRIFSNARELIVPFIPDVELQNVSFFIPQRGDKKELLDLSLRNLKYYKQEKLKQMEKVDPERHTNRILERLKSDLHLDELPRHIECFDNSNIQGKYPVSACVVFKDAKPSKKDYRHFNVKTVIGPDDFATMQEVLQRRYTRLVNENEPLPQLVIVDGGKGQLSSAVKIFKELGIFDKVQLIGIAKRLEEIFFPDDSIPLYLDKTSESLKVIQHLRNEAHRFGITHHRNRRSNDFIKSELNSIEGIGPKTVELLLSEFKSVEAIKDAEEKEIVKLIGSAKTKVIKNYFSNKIVNNDDKVENE